MKKKSLFLINLFVIVFSISSQTEITFSISGSIANTQLKEIELVKLDSNGLVFEAYDREFLENYDINIMDAGGPLFYNGPISQLDALDNYNVIHLLIHPRHWKSSFYWSTYENLKRLIQGIKY